MAEVALLSCTKLLSATACRLALDRIGLHWCGAEAFTSEALGMGSLAATSDPSDPLAVLASCWRVLIASMRDEVRPDVRNSQLSLGACYWFGVRSR